MKSLSMVFFTELEQKFQNFMETQKNMNSKCNFDKEK